MGTLTEVEGKPDPRYTGLNHSRSAAFSYQESDEGAGERKGSHED
jgi:hypothetical protein